MSNLTPSCAALLGLTGTSVACSAFSALYCAYKKVACKDKGAASSSDASASNESSTNAGTHEHKDILCNVASSPCLHKLMLAKDEATRNLPMLLAVMFAAHMCGKSRSLVDPIAPTLLGAGLVQSLTHFFECNRGASSDNTTASSSGGQSGSSTHSLARKIRCLMQGLNVGALGYVVLQLFDVL